MMGVGKIKSSQMSILLCAEINELRCQWLTNQWGAIKLHLLLLAVPFHNSNPNNIVGLRPFVTCSKGLDRHGSSQGILSILRLLPTMQ